MVQLGVAERPKMGQDISGDRYFVKQGADATLVAVIDGLGGGELAAQAAVQAYDAIVANVEAPLNMIMQAAHRACSGTRGAVVGLLRLHAGENRADYVGVGNIGVYVVSQHTIKPLSRNGIVGYRMPTLFEQHATYDPGDTFILFSDGISMKFIDAPLMHEQLEPQPLADRIMDEFGKTIDDVTVVVCKTPAQAAAE